MERKLNVFGRLDQMIGWMMAVVLIMLADAGAQATPVQSIAAMFNQPGVVTLSGYNAAHTLKIPMPKRWSVQSARLDLAYVNSSALMQKRSRLVIRVNETPVHQVDLSPRAVSGKISVAIPVDLLNKEYNDLTFAATQNFTDHGCIPMEAPEVWTSLKFYDSVVDIDYRLKPVPLSLASISEFLFDPKIIDGHRVHLVIEEATPQNTKLAALAASGVALRANYRPLSLTMGSMPEPGVDNIVIGSHAFINGLLSAFEIPGIQDHIGIMHLPRKPLEGNDPDVPEQPRFDASHALIYLSGPDDEAIDQAVRAFALLSHPLPAVASSQVTDAILPPVTQYSGHNVLAPGKEYEFKELGLNTHTFRGYKPQPAYLNFNLPSDVLLAANKNITISLNLSYAAQMREDSALNIYANDFFIASIALDNPQGGQYRKYNIELPQNYLQPGSNNIKIQAVLTPLHTGDCELLQTEHLALTLFADSQLVLPKFSHWAAMPKIQALFQDGFPLTQTPDFSGAHVVLADKSRETALAAVNLIALISQKTGIPPLGIEFSNELPPIQETEILMMGPLTSIPKDILDASPLFPVIDQPFWGRLPGTLREISRWEKFRASILPVSKPAEPVGTDVSQLALDMLAGSGKMLIHEFESPLAAMHSVVMCSADRPEDLLKGAKALWDQALQYQCRDGVVIMDLNPLKPVVKSYKTRKAYATGHVGSFSIISYYVNAAPRTFFIFLAVALVVLAAILTYLLKRRLARKTGQRGDQLEKQKQNTGDTP